ncbi:hypothetical protein OZN62_05305 [Aurantiacibacter sp. MUD11]|uniref:hypothetical protein n=1 Tax=Aurantiacibacter sp. MUD11 TaxID=3003265 RepID=UPI0022AAEC9F|nr:hypothetical protein [Aurantiacibacter sp. MUD11]WAT18986.1 hypothetical protein OZN62_05305 [Aurantiacibacter sp. MUD11]
MSSWLVIILVAAIVTAGWVMVERDRRKHGITRDWMGNESREGPQEDIEKKMLESEVEELRERVKVLERIATDPARRTAEEIEKLRDE